MTLRPAYAIAGLIVFAVEVLIARFVHDSVVRPYVGDCLAVVLVYLALRTVTPLSVLRAAIIAFLVAVAIEFGQLFHVLNALGLGHNRLARVVLGGVFDPRDIGCYALGALAAVTGDSFHQKAKP